MKTRWLLFLAMVFVLLPLRSAFAQSRATLRGTVTDESHATLPGVSVTATELATGLSKKTVTGSDGAYILTELAPGTYKLRLESSGFSAVEVEHLELLVGQSATSDFTMKVASVQVTVAVTGQTPLVDSQRAEVTGYVEPLQVQELPLEARDWMSLTMFVKNITANDVSTNPGVDRDEAFELNVDGQQVTSHLGQGRYGEGRYSEDAVGEYQVVTDMYDITQGRSTQIQVNAITKSGSNKFHGSAFGFFKNDAFDAADPVKGTVLPYSDQQLGGIIGGPIIRNKLFFFGSYEHEVETSTAISSPSLMPTEVIALPNQNTYQEYLGKADYQVSDRDHLTARVMHSNFGNPFANTAGNIYPSLALEQSQSATNVIASWVHTISPKKTLELKFGYSNFYFANLVPSFAQGLPELVFPGLNIGAPNNSPNAFWQQQYQWGAAFTWLVGKHAFKIGGEYFRDQDHGYWDINAYGTYTFSSAPPDMTTRFPASAWNNPAAWNLTGLDSYVELYTQNFRNNWTVAMPQNIWGMWFGDTWQVKERLSLTYGLRWDINDGEINPPGVKYSSIPINNGLFSGNFGYRAGHVDLHDFSPRIGFALRVDQKGSLVIRGGTGMFYAFPNDNIIYIKQLTSTYVGLNILNDGLPGFFGDPLRGVTATQILSGQVPLPPQLVVALDPNYKMPFTWQYSGGFQKQMGQSTSFDVDLIGFQWYHDEEDYDPNLFYNPATGYPLPPQTAGRPNPTYGPVWQTVSTGRRNYLALASSFTRRLQHGVTAGAAYTLMFYANDNSIPGSGATSGPANNQFCYLSCEWSRSTDFQRNTLRAYSTVELPKGFSVTPLVFYGSGNYFTTSLAQLPFTEGTDRLNTKAPITVPSNILSRFNGPAVIATGAIVPRDALKGLAVARLDLRLNKTFSIGERVRATLLGEVFNLTNHKNYGSYNGVLGTPTFGEPVQTAIFGGSGTSYAPLTGEFGFRVTF
ncbi:MAG: carboxypeptidase regulatory-like domain-containing protein [Terriglobales bacterium]|jgi:hypothetical protein